MLKKGMLKDNSIWHAVKLQLKQFVKNKAAQYAVKS